MCRIEIKGRLVAGFAKKPNEPPCYCQRFGVSMLTLSWCELKLILKGIASGCKADSVRSLGSAVRCPASLQISDFKFQISNLRSQPISPDRRVFRLKL